MVVGYANILIRLFGINSLKEKRSLVRTLINELKNKFEISVIESGRHDSKDYMMLGIAFATLSESDCEAKMDSIESFIEKIHTIEEFTYDLHHF
ncbi:MAG: DUF503 domain-containing protein [Fervidobacterium sp.]|nr:DUF503 domain-containing protein [Fervidobacterium sp.]